ncbi:unnamed protein product [Rhodiola kirilowii]
MSIMDNLFQRTLDDLIKGLRLQLIGESAFISKSLEEISREIKSTDPDTKSTALQKLTYLNSIYAVDMSFAAFRHLTSTTFTTISDIHLTGTTFTTISGIHLTGTTFTIISGIYLTVTTVTTSSGRTILPEVMSLRYVLLFECLSKVATPHLARDLTPERFRKIDSDKWEFANKGFVRGKKHLLKSIQRRKSPQMQQGVGFGGSLEVGRAGFEDELNKLREERKILTREVAELQIEQDGTAQHMELVNQRIQVAERKQKQMLIGQVLDLLFTSFDDGLEKSVKIQHKDHRPVTNLPVTGVTGRLRQFRSGIDSPARDDPSGHGRYGQLERTQERHGFWTPVTRRPGP